MLRAATLRTCRTQASRFAWTTRQLTCTTRYRPDETRRIKKRNKNQNNNKNKNKNENKTRWWRWGVVVQWRFVLHPSIACFSPLPLLPAVCLLLLRCWLLVALFAVTQNHTTRPPPHASTPPRASVVRQFAVLDSRVLITGSFNWTHGAAEDNCENIIICNKHQLVQLWCCCFPFCLVRVCARACVISGQLMRVFPCLFWLSFLLFCRPRRFSKSLSASGPGLPLDAVTQ